MLADPEREAAEGAESQEETDDIGESPPHLQEREGDGTNDHLEPGDDRRHVRSRPRALPSDAAYSLLSTAPIGKGNVVRPVVGEPPGGRHMVLCHRPFGT